MENENINDGVKLEDNNETYQESPLEIAQRESAEYKDKYLRALADADNIRKRSNENIANIKNTANESLLNSLLPTLDNFDRAFDNYTENSQKLTKKGIEILEGMSNVYRGLCNTLTSVGLTLIDIHPGDVFDVNTMEAISTIPGNGEMTVEHIVCKGYAYNGKVIRYAKVIVKN